jgi:hypothetical protein
MDQLVSCEVRANESMDSLLQSLGWEQQENQLENLELVQKEHVYV